MNKPIALEAIGYNDPATYGPVRAMADNFVPIVARVVTTTCVFIQLIDFAAAAQRAGTPDLGSMSRAVEGYFASLPDYQPGDFIMRSQIERVLTKLNDAGAPVPGADNIAERGLDDGSFIARELSTEAGRKFMRRLARLPGAFAHLDRLSSIPRGEKLIRDLIRDKDGDKIIEYLVTTKGGQRMGSMMAAVPDGTNLNKPTGRIYTVADLVAALKAAYAATSP